MSKGHMDATTGGAFLALTIDGAMALIKKMVANQSWWEEGKQQKGMHTVKETDMLATKMDLSLKRLDERASDKEAMKGTVKAMDFKVTCEVYGEVEHSRNDCPKTREEASYINNGFQQQNNNG
jgi:hypothetical protein